VGRCKDKTLTFVFVAIVLPQIIQDIVRQSTGCLAALLAGRMAQQCLNFLTGVATHTGLSVSAEPNQNLSLLLFAGALPVGLLASTIFEELFFSNVNFASGASLPAEWAGSQSLRLLQLFNVTGLTGGVPAAWDTGMPALNALMLDSVSGLSSALEDYVPLLTGPLRTAPASMYFSGLMSVRLNNIGLAGGVPAALFNHRLLQTLSLARNNLSGTLGGALWVTANSKALRSLDMSGNAFSGTLPPEWSTLSLYTLNLSRNNLTGGL
jgi:hypothetical protein